ncbi:MULTISPECIES: GtrA family protein [Mesorhizobium]|uniref:GtrA family protein n=1 Tax=Mesorhizobium TaxID=68287 RepID=UPI001FEEDC28|nr:MULTISPECIES: GtrA family protein [Mesorhizobium]
MRSSLPFDFPRMLRFGAVGLLNTASGYAVILAGLALGLNDILANATGYVTGLVLGFFRNRQWTFTRADGFRLGTLFRYGGIFLVAYNVNLAVAIAVRSAGITESSLVHLEAICVYSVVFCLGSAHFVFVGRESRADDKAEGNVRVNDELWRAPSSRIP